MPDYIVFLILFFSALPDLDALYFMVIKKETEIDSRFQHHFYSWAHYPLVYLPFVVIFVLSLIFNFYPIYFLIPVIGIYFGHFIPDTIACGDGVMWLKNPFKKDEFSPFINVFCVKTDGYHGKFWDARFRQTKAHLIENFIVIISIITIQTLQILYSIQKYPATSVYTLYLSCVVYLIGGLILGFKKYSETYTSEPPEGRYEDYRIRPEYIQGLSKKNREKHFKKHQILLQKHGILKSQFERKNK